MIGQARCRAQGIATRPPGAKAAAPCSIPSAVDQMSVRTELVRAALQGSTDQARFPTAGNLPQLRRLCSAVEQVWSC